jgi:hypothetical protein
VISKDEAYTLTQEHEDTMKKIEKAIDTNLKNGRYDTMVDNLPFPIISLLVEKYKSGGWSDVSFMYFACTGRTEILIVP